MMKRYFQDLKREFHGYNLQKLIKDLLSGVTVAAVALPLALAFGVSSGATPAAGLVTAIIGGVVIGLLSGASFQISGPTGAMSAILITIVAQYGLQGVFVASFAAGVVILLAGLLRLGKLVDFIPSSVVMGFTSGIAIIIALGQVDNFFGTVSDGSSALEKLWSYTGLGFHPQWQAVIVGAFVVVFMLLWPKRWNDKLPGSLVSIVLATILTAVCGFDQLALVGDIPKSLLLPDALRLSDLSFDMLKNLSSPIISIAALGMIESLLCGASASRMKDEPFDANRELVAQGVGNMLLPFFGGVPATAAIARTSVAIKSGEQTRLTGVFHAVFLFLSMILLGGVMARLPLSALAGVLMVTAWRMNEWHGIKRIFGRRIYSGVAQFLITMIATVVFDLTVAIVIGIASAAVMFIVSAARLQTETDETDDEMTVRLHGAVFFGNTGALKRRLEGLPLTGRESLTFDLSGVPVMDVSGAQALVEQCAALCAQGVRVDVRGAQQKTQTLLEKMGLAEQKMDQFNSAPSAEETANKGV